MGQFMSFKGTDTSSYKDILKKLIGMHFRLATKVNQMNQFMRNANAAVNSLKSQNSKLRFESLYLNDVIKKEKLATKYLREKLKTCDQALAFESAEKRRYKLVNSRQILLIQKLKAAGVLKGNSRHLTVATFKNEPKTCKYLTGLTLSQIKCEFDKVKDNFKKYDLYSSVQPKEKSMEDECWTTSLPPLKKRFSGGLSEASLLGYFIIMLVRLRRGMTLDELSILFGMKKPSLSVLLRNMFKLVGRMAHACIRFTAKSYNENIPNIVRTKRDKNKIYLLTDATYLNIQKSWNLEFQRATYCSYKSHNLYKLLTINSPNGSRVYWQELFEGSESDEKCFFQSNVVRKLYEIHKTFKKDICLIADKGFFDTYKSQKLPEWLIVETPRDVFGVKNYLSCSIRISVENYYAHLKHWRLLKRIDNNFLDILPEIVSYSIYLNNKYLSIIRQ